MELDLGPLNVLVCWQTFILALGVAIATQGVKRALDYSVGGKEERQKRMFINRLVLPGTPITLGAVAAVLVPLHPEALTQYIAANGFTGMKQYSILAVFGMCVGQFSDYVWHRFSGITDDVTKRRKKKPASSDSKAEPDSKPEVEGPPSP